MRALILTLFLALNANAATVSLHGRLLAKGSRSIFVYSENGQEKEIEVTKSLDDFRGQMMTVTGTFQDNFFLVESALTDKNSFIRGKKGRGFKGSGTVDIRADEPHMTPHLSKAALDELKSTSFKMVFPGGEARADRALAVADVTGIIVNDEIHILPGFDGFRIRQEKIEVQAGDSVIIIGKLLSAGHAGEFRISADWIWVVNKESLVAMPAFTNQALSGTPLTDDMRSFIEPNEEVKIAGMIDASGHIIMEDVLPNFDFFGNADAGLPEAVDKSKCETNVTAGKFKPKLRLIKFDDEE